MSCSWFINETRLWNVSSCSSKNYSLSSILPVVPFLLDHSFDFNIPLAQPLVSTMWTPKSFNFDGQFALIIPVPIGMTIFLEITLQPCILQSPHLSLVQETYHLRGLVYLVLFAQWHYYYFLSLLLFLYLIKTCLAEILFHLLKRICRPHS